MIGDRDRAVFVVELGGRVDAECFQDRGVKIGNRDRAVDDLSAKLVGLANDLSGPDSTAK